MHQLKFYFIVYIRFLISVTAAICSHLIVVQPTPPGFKREQVGLENGNSVLKHCQQWFWLLLYFIKFWFLVSKFKPFQCVWFCKKPGMCNLQPPPCWCSNQQCSLAEFCIACWCVSFIHSVEANCSHRGKCSMHM